MKKYNQKYSQKIKKEVYDLLNKYVNETNITTDNYQELLIAKNRKIVLSGIYTKYKNKKSLIDDFCYKFYNNISSKKSYKKKVKYTKKIKKSNDNFYNKNKKKAEESILKFIREDIGNNNIYDFFQKKFYEEDKYNIYNWLLIKANSNYCLKNRLYFNKKKELNSKLNDEKLLIESLKKRLKENKDNIKDFESNFEKKEDTYLKKKFEKYYKDKNNELSKFEIYFNF